jgi:serine/threonine protein kinase
MSVMSSGCIAFCVWHFSASLHPYLAFGPGLLLDLRALLFPKEAVWNPIRNHSGLAWAAWLLDVYDWDQVALEHVAALSFKLRLCFGLFPCAMHIKGKSVGVIQRQGTGYISCLFSDGCETVRLEGIKFFCDSAQHQNSSIKIQGSSLSIVNSSFAGCVSNEDGGVIQSYDRSTVRVSMSTFINSSSGGFGGAIAAYGGSVHISDSTFSDTFASRGGGAIWSLSYRSCYGLTQYHDTMLEVEGSNFTNCITKGDGGAILVSSDLSESGLGAESLFVLIKSSSFAHCLSSGYGGALHVSGYGVSLALHGSVIHSNIASACGGAISMNMSELVLIDSKLNNNSALGFGGGALFLKESSIYSSRSSCAENRAPAGGGGVLLYQGSKIPSAEAITHLCYQNNSAGYGPCMASECKAINLIFNSSELIKRWAGVSIKLAVMKLDAYQQIILTDNSIVEMLPSSSDVTALEDQKSLFSFIGGSIFRFVEGNAFLEVVIKPTFAPISSESSDVARIQSKPIFFVQSLDAQTGAIMKSNVVFIKLEEAESVCPQGYILDLDSKNSGACKSCQRETYRVNPLVFRQNSSQGSCLMCPAGALCPDGSCVFYHSLSNRTCPGGYRIVGDWVVDNISQQLTLRGCPAGYFASSQQCDLCPAAFYCTGGNVPSRPCPSGSFTPPGKTSSLSCLPSVFVTVTVNVPVKRPEFKENRALQFQNILANFTKWDCGYVTIKLVQSGDDPETTTITSDIVAPDAKTAAALVKTLNSGMQFAWLAFNSGYDRAINLISVQVTQCVPGFELNLNTKMCQLCPANYFCVGRDQGREACPTDHGFAPPGSNSTASCTSAVFLTLVFSIPISQDNVTDTVRSKIVVAVSMAADIVSERVAITGFGGAVKRSVGTASESLCMTAARVCQPESSSPPVLSNTFNLIPLEKDKARIGAGLGLYDARRAAGPGSVRITAMLAAEGYASAAAIKRKLDFPNLNKQLLAVGLPQGTLISISMPEPSVGGSDPSLSASAVIGGSIGAVVFLAVFIVAGFWLLLQKRKRNEHAECVAALSCSIVGAAALNKHLPPELRTTYTPDLILGKCVRGNGCVVQAKPTGNYQAKRTNNSKLAAIKIRMPLGTAFKETEMEQIKREVGAITLLSEKRCEFSARLSFETGYSGQDVVFFSRKMCWYIMEPLKGECMNTVILASCADAVECINVSQDVLAALSIVHADGLLHLNIQPENIFRCKAPGRGDGREFMYKLIGFGTAQEIDDTAAKEAVASFAGTLAIGAGMPSYMSPEMFKNPCDASFPSDIWSLGTTMFELVSGTLPFQRDSSQDWEAVIAENMAEKAPNVLDRIGAERRSEFEYSLASVIAKALEKRQVNRYVSADEMHGAAFACLVVHSKAAYSVYLSYRAESDGPLAKLLFDELNHSRTPGGHRVTVYLDICSGHIQGTNWDEDIAKGLLHSTLYCPILSFGATAPMAQLPETARNQLITMGWGETPLGLTRLCGAEQDREDALLKEMLIANIVLERSSESGGLLGGEGGQLCSVLPIFAGRMQPLGHSEYPLMGNYFDVHCGGGIFSALPSPSSSKAAAQFLLDRAGLPVEAVTQAEDSACSVASVVAGLSRQQGCRLWDHSSDVVEAALTKDQRALVGKGYVGPPVSLDDNLLSAEQVVPPSLAPSCDPCPQTHHFEHAAHTPEHKSQRRPPLAGFLSGPIVMLCAATPCQLAQAGPSPGCLQQYSLLHAKPAQ